MEIELLFMSQEPQIVVVIPARYASVRFPGKPLASLDGVPVIVHVARAALQIADVRVPVVVATDDERNRAGGARSLRRAAGRGRDDR